MPRTRRPPRWVLGRYKSASHPSTLKLSPTLESSASRASRVSRHNMLRSWPTDKCVRETDPVPGTMMTEPLMAEYPRTTLSFPYTDIDKDCPTSIPASQRLRELTPVHPGLGVASEIVSDPLNR